MYLRFTTKFVNKEDKPETGIFQALAFIRDHNRTNDIDERLLIELGYWFSDHLDAPKFHTDPIELGWERKALSWFKDSAKNHILKIEELIEILERYDLIIERIHTKRPGIVVFEDDFQVAAIPFERDVKKVK